MAELTTRLILVEGVPFTGKSTLSEYIADQLRSNGVQARWVPEGTMLREHFPHVLSLDDGVPVSDEALREDWRAFVEAVARDPSILVVDSPLSYAGLYPFLAQDRPIDQILTWLKDVMWLCAPVRPRVIHLTGDVTRLIPTSIEQRGEGWRTHLVDQADATPYQLARGRSGLQDTILMLEETQALTRRLLSEGWQTLTLDVTDGRWPEHQRAVLGFLGLAEVEDQPPVLAQTLLSSYTGTYAAAEPSEGPTTLSVSLLEANALVLEGPNIRYGLLIPRSERRFHLRASTLDIEMEVEGDEARGLIVHSTEGRTQRRYHRL